MVIIDNEALEDLRNSVHQMVNLAFDQAIHTAQQRAEQGEMELLIVSRNAQEKFTYTFPDGPLTFHEGRWYVVTGSYGTVNMLLAKGEAEIWREVRQMYFVFGRKGWSRKGGSENPLTVGDWAQFVRTDDGEFASAIRDPSDPQKMLKAGMPLPARYTNAKVARRDELFAPVKTGPTLWYVVEEVDSNAMLTHGYYAGHSHGYF